MPYICLARNDISDGSIQILDLSPNTSQPKPPYAKGQTKYVNYPTLGDATAKFTTGAATQSTTADISGLAAFFLDRFEVSNSDQATARLNVSGNPSGGDTLIFAKGVATKTITFVTPGPAGPDEVLIGLNVAATLTNLLAFLNNAGNRTAYDVAFGFHFVADNNGITGGCDITSTGTGSYGVDGICTLAYTGTVFKWTFGGSFGAANVSEVTRTHLTLEKMNQNLLDRLVSKVLTVTASGYSFNDYNVYLNMYNPNLNVTTNTAASMLVTSTEKHGLTTGDTVKFNFGAGGATSDVNGKDWAVTVVSEYIFTVPFDNSGSAVTGTGTLYFSGFAQPLNLIPYAGLDDFKILMSLASGAGYSLLAGSQTYAPLTVAGGITVAQKTAAVGTQTYEDTSTGPQTPATTHPISVTLPIKPIRGTTATAAFNMSITQGALAKLAGPQPGTLHATSYITSDVGATGWATTLAGDPIRSYPYQGARANLKGGFVTESPSLTPIRGRLVTVYDDFGTVLV